MSRKIGVELCLHTILNRVYVQYINNDVKADSTLLLLKSLVPELCIATLKGPLSLSTLAFVPSLLSATSAPNADIQSKASPWLTLACGTLELGL